MTTSAASVQEGPRWRGLAEPMLAVAGAPPRGEPGRWWREWKHDGHRCRVIADTAGVRLVSRGGRTVTARFPEVTAALTEVLTGRMVVLDGELVAPGAGGVPDFERLQTRARTTATTARVAATPVVLVVFDLLAVDDVDVTTRPLSQRRALLEDLGLGPDPRLLLSPVFVDTDPDLLLSVAREHGMEGVVSKRASSLYAPGRRSKAWIKTVLVETRDDLVVGGVAQGRARRPNAVGALLLGARTADGGLEYVGEVGTGWTRSEHTHLVARLTDLATDSCPFTVGAGRLPRGAWFVRPELGGRVAYREHRPGGLLRHPSWKGLLDPS